MVDTPSDLTTCLAISGGDTFGRTMSALKQQKTKQKGSGKINHFVWTAGRGEGGQSSMLLPYMVCSINERPWSRFEIKQTHAQGSKSWPRLTILLPHLEVYRTRYARTRSNLVKASKLRSNMLHTRPAQSGEQKANKWQSETRYFACGLEMENQYSCAQRPLFIRGSLRCCPLTP